VTPEALLKRFEEVLAEEYGAGRVTKQARSVQVAFPKFDGLYVDAVPARPFDRVWKIPQHAAPIVAGDRTVPAGNRRYG
jgi:hypothetical protein